eukprot:COSAG02_NODE_5655_length_4148_cov_172.597184_5_plen_31_part_00
MAKYERSAVQSIEAALALHIGSEENNGAKL